MGLILSGFTHEIANFFLRVIACVSVLGFLLEEQYVNFGACFPVFVFNLFPQKIFNFRDFFFRGFVSIFVLDFRDFFLGKLRAPA